MLLLSCGFSVWRHLGTRNSFSSPLTHPQSVSWKLLSGSKIIIQSNNGTKVLIGSGTSSGRPSLIETEQEEQNRDQIYHTNKTPI
jgi:hypothetical protein